MPAEVAFVTGGSGGIAQAVVKALRARGVRVGVIDLEKPEDADGAVRADISDPTAATAAVGWLLDRLGTPDHLICAAGVVSEHPLEQLEPDAWRRVVEVSLTGTYLAMQLVVPHMVRRRAGSVVALSSGYGTSGYRFGGHYAAAKAGVEALVKSVAQEVGPAGVRVNAVAPGPVLTPFVDHIDDFEGWRRDREARIPLGRLAEAEDVVGPILFLLGEDARYVTGQILHVNGGMLMP